MAWNKAYAASSASISILLWSSASRNLGFTPPQINLQNEFYCNSQYFFSPGTLHRGICREAVGRVNWSPMAAGAYRTTPDWGSGPNRLDTNEASPQKQAMCV